MEHCTHSHITAAPERGKPEISERVDLREANVAQEARLHPVDPSQNRSSSVVQSRCGAFQKREDLSLIQTHELRGRKESLPFHKRFQPPACLGCYVLRCSKHTKLRIENAAEKFEIFAMEETPVQNMEGFFAGVEEHLIRCAPLMQLGLHSEELVQRFRERSGS